VDSDFRKEFRFTESPSFIMVTADECVACRKGDPISACILSHCKLVLAVTDGYVHQCRLYCKRLGRLAGTKLQRKERRDAEWGE